MENKCNKYEALFTFSNENDFLNHVKNCASCESEHLVLNKISSLIKEVAPEYLARERRSNLRKAVSCCLCLVIGITGVIGYQINNYVSQNIGYSTSSIIYQQGLPVDDYGFLKI